MSNKVAKPATILKEFFSKPEHFADVINAVFFDGNEVVCPEMLMEADTDVSSTIQVKDKTISLERFRDVVKKTVYGCDWVIVGLENQLKVHYGMPLRTMTYDVLNYLKQCEEVREKHKKEKSKPTAEEFLSGLKRGDKLHPVFTLVIYYGEDRWDGPLSLRDMLDVPEDWKIFLPDYGMNLLEVRESGRYHFRNQEVDEVFEISRTIFEKNYAILKEKYGKKEISTEAAMAVGAITGSKRLLRYVTESEKGEMNMCRALEELEQEAMKRGVERGLERGLERGKSEQALIIVKNMLRKGLDMKDIAEMAEVPLEIVRKVKAEL